MNPEFRTEVPSTFREKIGMIVKNSEPSNQK